MHFAAVTSSLAACASFAVAAASHAQSVLCPSVDQFYREHGSVGTVPSPTEASLLGDRLLAELNNDPVSPCADGIRKILISTLPLASREPEAMAVAESGARRGSDYISRCMFANNALSLRLEIEGRNLSTASQAHCRELASEVLANAPTFDERLSAQEMGEDLSTELVLYHVLATTEPSATARIEALRRLVGFVRAADARSFAEGHPGKFRFELGVLITDFISTRLAEGEAIAHAELVDLCAALPSKLDRAIACSKVLGSPSLHRERKLQLLETLAPSLDPVWFVRDRYDLFRGQKQTLDATSDQSVVRSVLAEADALWLAVVAVEQDNPPIDPEAPRSPQALDNVIKGLLYDRCELGLRVLKDPAYATAGHEYLRRFPDARAPKLRRWLQNVGQE